MATRRPPIIGILAGLAALLLTLALPVGSQQRPADLQPLPAVPPPPPGIVDDLVQYLRSVLDESDARRITRRCA